MDNKFNFNISWKACMRIAVSVLIVFLLFRYWGSIEGFFALLFGGMLAIFAGLAISYVLNIPMRFFESKLPGEKGDGTRNRMFSLVLSCLCAVMVLLLVGILVLPNLVDAIVKLATDAPGVIASLADNEFLASFIPPNILVELKTIDWEQVINDIANWLQSGVVSSLPQIMSLVGQIGAVFMGVVLAFWFLSEKNTLSQGIHRLIRTYISEGADEKFKGMINVADTCFSGYFVGQATESVIYGSLVAIVCTIAGLPDPLMLGALVGVMSLIPLIGAFIGGVLDTIILLAYSWQQALLFFVIFFIIMQIEGNIIYPRVMGKHVGLTGLWPLIGITLGTTLFGFAGAFIGVPLIATIFRFVQDDIENREQSDGKSFTPFEKLQKSLTD